MYDLNKKAMVFWPMPIAIVNAPSAYLTYKCPLLEVVEGNIWY